jgi:hypothetical protein
MNISYAVDGIVVAGPQSGHRLRVFWSAGAAAMRMAPAQGHRFALAVAISVTETSPFRDIPVKYGEINERVP